MVGMESLWSLRRSRTNSHLGGVCGALAARWDIDPLLVRIIAVLAALSAGVGAVLYGACWLLLPREGENETPLQQRFPRAASWSHQTWLVIVGVACVLSFISLSGPLSIGIVPTVVIVGVVLWNRRRRGAPGSPPSAIRGTPDGYGEPGPQSRTAAAPTPGYPPMHDPFRGPDTPFTDSARAWQLRVQQATAGEPEAPHWGSQPPAWQAPIAPPASPSTSAVKSYLTVPDPVGLYGPGETTTVVAPKRAISRAIPLTAVVLTLAMLGLFVGQLLGLAVTTPIYWGVAVLILGLACIVNAWRSQTGRRGGRWLAVAAIVASLMAVGANFSTTAPSSVETRLSYATFQSLPPVLTLNSGDAKIDLSRFPVEEDRTLSVQMKAGSLDVTLPESARVRVIAHSRVGELRVLNERAEGLGPELDVTGGDSGPILTLDINVDYGEVQVQR